MLSYTNEHGVLIKVNTGSWKCDLSSIFRKMQAKQEFSDVTFVVEGREFPAHRIILASCSPFFENLLSNGFKETWQNAISMGEVSADAFGIVLDFIYGKKITVSSAELGVEIIGCAHRYELEGLQTFMADYLCFEENKHGVDDDAYAFCLVDAANAPQNTELKEHLFHALGDVSKHFNKYMEHVYSWDVLEEVLRLSDTALICQGEMEILNGILDCFSRDWRGGEENEEQRKRILSQVDKDKMSKWDLELAIEKCLPLFLFYPSVREFRDSCIERLENENYDFERTTPIPCGKRLADYRNVELFSFKQRVSLPSSLKSPLETEKCRDYLSDTTCWMILRKVDSGDIELELRIDTSSLDAQFIIFVLDLTEKKLLFGEKGKSCSDSSGETIRFNPGEWEQLVDTKTNTVVVGATIYNDDI